MTESAIVTSLPHQLADLLQRDSTACLVEWQTLDDPALIAEIARYRDGIRDAEERLVKDGARLWAPSTSGRDAVQHAGSGALAAEALAGGADYTLGCIDDLDETEWQVWG